MIALPQFHPRPEVLMTPALNSLYRLLRSCSTGVFIATATACVGGGGGGGTSAVPAAGKEGDKCNPKAMAQGCAGKQPMNCAADADPANTLGGKWEKLGAECGADEYCNNKYDAAAKLNSASCAKTAVVNTGTDTVGADGGPTLTDTATDTNTAGTDTKTGSDGTVAIDGIIADIDTGAMVTCLKTKCGAQYSACKADTECAKALACVEVCKDIACMAKCPTPPETNVAVQKVQSCMAEMKCIPSSPPSPVCGNGTCEPGENVEMCAKDCKPAGTSVCPNGKCTSGETCPMDCNSKFAASMQCAWGECSSQMAACSAKAPCVEELNCLISCNCDNACKQKCATVPGATSAEVSSLGGCMSEMNCPDPCTTTTPTCPNGVCDPDETPSTCPQDCKTTSPVCGNGQCESGETAANCPPDCGTTTGHVCDTACGGPAPSNKCYCDSACKGAGDCCNAQGTGQAGSSCAGSTCADCK